MSEKLPDYEYVYKCRLGDILDIEISEGGTLRMLIVQHAFDHAMRPAMASSNHRWRIKATDIWMEHNIVCIQIVLEDDGTWEEFKENLREI